jgi:hypothetical protein
MELGPLPSFSSKFDAHCFLLNCALEVSAVLVLSSPDEVLLGTAFAKYTPLLGPSPAELLGITFAKYTSFVTVGAFNCGPLLSLPPLTAGGSLPSRLRRAGVPAALIATCPARAGIFFSAGALV